MLNGSPLHPRKIRSVAPHLAAARRCPRSDMFRPASHSRLNKVVALPPLPSLARCRLSRYSCARPRTSRPDCSSVDTLESAGRTARRCGCSLPMWRRQYMNHSVPLRQRPRPPGAVCASRYERSMFRVGDSRLSHGSGPLGTKEDRKTGHPTHSGKPCRRERRP